MSYIGKEPQIGNFQICDAISTVNNQAAYTMQVGSVNVIPETAQNMIVSLNGVIQKPNSSYTVAGAVITFSSALVTGDVINFIQILGDVLDLGVPSDGTVTSGKIANDAVTLAKMASGTDGNIISYDSSGNPVAVATGSSGQVLTSAGAGAVPSFATAASSDFVLLQTNTITSSTASTSFDGLFSSTYKNYIVYYDHLIPVEDSRLLYLRVRQSNSDVTTSNAYGFANAGVFRQDGSGDGTFSAGGNNSYIALNYNRNGSNAAADGGFSGIIDILDPLNATCHKLISGKVDYIKDDASIFQTTDFIGRFEGNTNALSGFTLYISAGNIATGVVKLYGIK